MRALLFLIIIAVIAFVGHHAYQYFSIPQTYPDGSIGRVEREETQTEICVSVSGDCAIADEAGSIFLNNMVRTNETGLMRAILVDETELSVGPFSEFVIDEYVYKPRTLGTFTMSLLSGSLRFLSGNMSNASDRKMRVDTPVASIGVRGTDFWVRQFGDRLDVVLIDGEIEVSNELGGVILRNEGDYAYVAGPDVAPLLRNDLSRGEIFELLSSTSFDDELDDLLDPDNAFRTDGEE